MASDVVQTAEGSWEARLGPLVVGTVTARPGSGPQARYVRLFVEPDHRRRGLGRRLLDAAGDAVRPAGFGVLEGIAVRGSDGERFARALGANVGDELVDDVLDCGTVDPGQLQQLALPPAGTSIVAWTGPAPEDLVGSYARAKRVIADAPNRYGPAVPAWDSALVRAAERDRAERGAVLWVAAAVVAGTTTVVAFTELAVDAGRAASQHDTVVVAGYRRRGLASALKADLLIRLRRDRPDVASVTVTTAAANVGMRAVNRRLGYREAQRRDLYRLAL